MAKLPPFSSPPPAMQWAGLIIAAVLSAAPLVIAYLTRNPAYLVPYVPLSFLWYSIAKFLYKRPEDYRLDELRIKQGGEKQHQEKQKP